MTVTCPCFIATVPGQRVPWGQDAFLSPSGKRIYHLEYVGGTDPYAIGHTVPEMLPVDPIPLPSEGHWPTLGVSVGGMCSDADGTIWCLVNQSASHSSLDPDYQYHSAVYKRVLGSWVKVWEDLYGSNSPEDYNTDYEDGTNNGIFYDAFNDMVLFVTQVSYLDGGNRRTKYYRIRDAKSGALIREDGPAAFGESVNVAPQYGVSQFMIDPTNGYIWNTTLGNALGSISNAVLLRRWLPGFTSPVDIDYQVLFSTSGGTSMMIPSPDHPGHILCSTRPDGSASAYQIRRFNQDGVLQESSFCTNSSIYWPLFTPDLLRVASLQFSGSTGSDDLLVDWTLRCDPEQEPPDVVLPLRQRQRDDVIRARGAAPNRPRSKQASIRQYWNNTYL